MRLGISIALLIVACASPVSAAPPIRAPAGTIQRSPALDKVLAGSVAGAPVDCIDLPRVQGSTTYANPDTIVYRAPGRRLFVNQPVGGCNFRSDPILVSRTPSTRLCRGDIITLLDRSSRFPVGSCGLGSFVPYEKAK